MTHCNKTDTQVLVCRWNDDVVAAFRGTELKLRDWLSDLDGKLVPNQGGGGRVHSGFQTALNSVYSEIVHCMDAMAESGARRLFACVHLVNQRMPFASSHSVSQKCRQHSVCPDNRLSPPANVGGLSRRYSRKRHSFW